MLAKCSPILHVPVESVVAFALPAPFMPEIDHAVGTLVPVLSVKCHWMICPDTGACARVKRTLRTVSLATINDVALRAVRFRPEGEEEEERDVRELLLLPIAMEDEENGAMELPPAPLLLLEAGGAEDDDPAALDELFWTRKTTSSSTNRRRMRIAEIVRMRIAQSVSLSFRLSFFLGVSMAMTCAAYNTPCVYPSAHLSRD